MCKTRMYKFNNKCHKEDNNNWQRVLQNLLKTVNPTNNDKEFIINFFLVELLINDFIVFNNDFLKKNSKTFVVVCWIHYWISTLFSTINSTINTLCRTSSNKLCKCLILNFMHFLKNSTVVLFWRNVFLLFR